MNGQYGMFPTTNWSDLAALRLKDQEGDQALERLCSAYWFPIFAYIRRQTADPDRARDLTQGFFEQLLERDSLTRLAFDKGRFRSFLLTACRHFLADAHRFDNREIRRPLAGLIDLESASLETRYADSLSSNDSPEQLFERQWALTAIGRSFETVESDYRQRGKSELFSLLHQYLDEDPGALPHGETASRLGMSEAAVKVELHRLRERLRTALKEEVSATLSDSEAAESELSALLRALAG